MVQSFFLTPSEVHGVVIHGNTDLARRRFTMPSRQRAVMTISLPPRMADEYRRLAREKGETASEFFSEIFAFLCRSRSVSGCPHIRRLAADLLGDLAEMEPVDGEGDGGREEAGPAGERPEEQPPVVEPFLAQNSQYEHGFD